MTDIHKHTETLQYRACEMRIMGHDYPTIAEFLGLSIEEACESVRKELEQSEERRNPETEYLATVERLRRMLDAIKEKADAGNEKAFPLTIRIIQLWEGLKADRAHQCTTME